jgi:hypothetical protein
MDAREPASASIPQQRCVLWVGATTGTELGLAHRWLAERAAVIVAETAFAAPAAVEAAGRGLPVLAVFATDRPGRFSLDDVLAIAREWPLASLVSVVASLADGRRRSGPPLSGIEEVAWHELPGRLERWFADLAAGRPGLLGLPATSRREERILAASDSLRASRAAHEPLPVSVVAARSDDLDGLVDLIALSGRRIARRTRGRPPLDEPAALLVWDVGCLGEEDIAWLRMLVANRPDLAVVLLESFPRGEATEAALEAGAKAVLGRPVTLEVLEGTLARLEGTLAGLGLRGP